MYVCMRVWLPHSSVELRDSCFILVEEYPVPKAHLQIIIYSGLCSMKLSHLSTCWCLFIRTHIHMYTCIHVCMYVCMYVCMEYMFTCMYACMHICMYVCMYVCAYVCLYAYMYAYMHTCIHVF